MPPPSCNQTHGLSQYLLTAKKCRTEKEPSKIETWRALFETASATFLRNNTGKLWLSFLREDTCESEIHFLLVCRKYSAPRRNAYNC